jgi:hypothetical protein
VGLASRGTMQRDGVVSPHVCDPMVVPHRWVVREWYNPVGQPWMLVVTLPSVHDGLRVLLMAVLWTFRRLSMGRPAHRQLTRTALLDLTTIIPATTCHQRNYVEAYSRSIRLALHRVCWDTQTRRGPQQAGQ